MENFHFWQPPPYNPLNSVPCWMEGKVLTDKKSFFIHFFIVGNFIYNTTWAWDSALYFYSQSIRKYGKVPWTIFFMIPHLIFWSHLVVVVHVFASCCFLLVLGKSNDDGKNFLFSCFSRWVTMTRRFIITWRRMTKRKILLLFFPLFLS